jgi:CheY-like chemotaxis protein
VSTPPVILVVDDEPRILSALRRCLRREGYEILTAETPAEALAVLEVRDVQAIVSDHKMPGMSGLAFLAQAVARRPDAALLLITGWTEEVPAEELAALGVHTLLPKPWDDAALKTALRDAVVSRGGRGTRGPSSGSSSRRP